MCTIFRNKYRLTDIENILLVAREGRMGEERTGSLG